MPDYSKGKIYKIVSNCTNKIYIGSTTLDRLSTRLALHRHHGKNLIKYKNITSRKILKYGDAKIILLEKYPCETRDELMAREQYWMDKYKHLHVNKLNSVPVKENSIKYRENNIRRKICLYCDIDLNANAYKIHCESHNHKKNVKIMNKILEE